MGRRQSTESYTQLAKFLAHQKIDVISKEKEQVLVTVYQKTGDRKSLNKLVSSNQKFVAKVAFKFLHSGLPMEDLMLEGSLGLVHAIKKFDVRSNYRLISYGVWWITHYIRRFVQDHCHEMKQSSLIQTKLSSLNNKDLGWSQCIGGKFWFSEKDLLEKCSFSPEILKEVFSIQEGMISLDQPLKESESDMTVLDTISREENETITNLEANENKKIVSKLLSSLDPRLRGIIKSLYGLDDENYKTLHDVGEDLNLSRERIRQLRDQALKILKSESRFLKYTI